MEHKDWKLEPKEREILESFNKGEWISTNENLDKYKQAAIQKMVQIAQKATQGK